METGTQASEIRYHSSMKRTALVKKEKKPKHMVSAILEEAKRLEYLNRQINKTTGKNIIKHLTDFRKAGNLVQTPLQKHDSGYTNLYENLLKKPQDMFKDLKSSGLLTEIIEKKRIKTPAIPKENHVKSSEFDDINFKEILWPQQAVIDDELYEIMNFHGNPRTLSEDPWAAGRHTVYKRRIKSRIGELGRKYEKLDRRRTADREKKTSQRGITPWIYTSDNDSSIFKPCF